MKYRLLGNSGLRVSELALGTMTFGEDWGWGAGKEEAKKLYDAYREAGGNFLDTANLYTNGSSESFLGEFLQDHRQSMVLATKYTNAMPGTDPNAAGNHRKSWQFSNPVVGQRNNYGCGPCIEAVVEIVVTAHYIRSKHNQVGFCVCFSEVRLDIGRFKTSQKMV